MKKDWIPTQGEFRQFLHWVDEGVDSDGERYLGAAPPVGLYFDRKNCLAADDLADETLKRVAQKFQEQGEITNISPAHYCYVVAKFVFLDTCAGSSTATPALTIAPIPLTPPGRNTSRKRETRDADCLTPPPKTLPEADRELILEYYVGEQQEKIPAAAKHCVGPWPYHQCADYPGLPHSRQA